MFPPLCPRKLLLRDPNEKHTENSQGADQPTDSVGVAVPTQLSFALDQIELGSGRSTLASQGPGLVSLKCSALAACSSFAESPSAVRLVSLGYRELTARKASELLRN